MPPLRPLALAALLATTTTPAAAWDIHSAYTLTIRARASAFDGKQLCLNLQQDGAVANLATSGTWTAPGGSGGYFTILGKQLQLFGALNDGFISLTAIITGNATQLTGAAVTVDAPAPTAAPPRASSPPRKPQAPAST